MICRQDGLPNHILTKEYISFGTTYIDVVMTQSNKLGAKEESMPTALFVVGGII